MASDDKLRRAYNELMIAAQEQTKAQESAAAQQMVNSTQKMEAISVKAGKDVAELKAAVSSLAKDMSTMREIAKDMVNVKAAVAELRGIAAKQNFQTAIALLAAPSTSPEFDFEIRRRDTRILLPIKSRTELMKILRAFLQGQGMYLEEGYIFAGHHIQYTAEACADYHDRLVEELHMLTGLRPSLKKYDDGRVAIMPPSAGS